MAKSAVAGTGAVAGAAIATGREQLVDRIAPAVNARMEALEARVDAMEHHHRNLLRVGAIGLAVSTGIDLTILL